MRWADHVKRRLVRTGCLALLAWPMQMAAEAADVGLHFERVGSESGPPQEVITSLWQDRTGFIWIGSRDRGAPPGAGPSGSWGTASSWSVSGDPPR